MLQIALHTLEIHISDPLQGWGKGACAVGAKIAGAQFHKNVKGWAWDRTSRTPGLLSLEPSYPSLAVHPIRDASRVLKYFSPNPYNPGLALKRTAHTLPPPTCCPTWTPFVATVWLFFTFIWSKIPEKLTWWKTKKVLIKWWYMVWKSSETCKTHIKLL